MFSSTPGKAVRFGLCKSRTFRMDLTISSVTLGYTLLLCVEITHTCGLIDVGRFLASKNVKPTKK